MPYSVQSVFLLQRDLLRIPSVDQPFCKSLGSSTFWSSINWTHNVVVLIVNWAESRLTWEMGRWWAYLWKIILMVLIGGKTCPLWVSLSPDWDPELYKWRKKMRSGMHSLLSDCRYTVTRQAQQAPAALTSLHDVLWPSLRRNKSSSPF